MPKLSEVILHGDCIEVMESMEDNSIDAIVDDPPYFLGFMGKEWDTFKPKQHQDFMFKVGEQKLRILKPGAYNLSFSGTRTYHRMVVGLEDAGFKIKDMLMWCYGSGFPKSLNLSIAIDKHLGKEREIIGKGKSGKSESHNVMNMAKLGSSAMGGEYDITKPNTIDAQKWNGWGTGLKPSFEPIVVAQKPYIGTYAENVLKYGVGGLNIDGSRIHTNKENEPRKKWEEPSGQFIGYKGKSSELIVGYGSEIKNKTLTEYAEKGRFPANLLLTHHPDCQLIGTKEVKTSTLLKKHDIKRENNRNVKIYPNSQPSNQDYGKNGRETVASYSCHPDCPIRMLDEQSGELKSGNLSSTHTAHRTKYGNGVYQDSKTMAIYPNRTGDKGGASRFFKTFNGVTRFIYNGKAHKSERNAGLVDLIDTPNTEMVNRKEGSAGIENPRAGAGRGKGAKNDIATLKPINVMRYLVRLVTPPNGIVLDPFAGSGTTGIACILEGFHYILIEKRERFAKTIIPKRLEYWKNPSNWSVLKDHNVLPKIKRMKNEKQNKSLEAYF